MVWHKGSTPQAVCQVEGLNSVIECGGAIVGCTGGVSQGARVDSQCQAPSISALLLGATPTKKGTSLMEEIQLRKEEMQVRCRGGQVLQGRSSAPEEEKGRRRG